MKRDTWIPSKHQVLCSDHFTPDSLDVRWGIRYLKTTAVPTIFSAPDNQEKEIFQKAQEKRTEHVKDKNPRNTTASFLKPCSPKMNNMIEERLYRKALCTTLSKSSQQKVPLQDAVKSEDIIIYPDDSIRQTLEQTNPVVITTDIQMITTSDSCTPKTMSFNKAVDHLFSGSTTILQTTVHNLQSCLECISDPKATVSQPLDFKTLDPSLESNNNVTVPVNTLPPDELGSHMACCTVEVKPSSEKSLLLHTVSQALEQFSGDKESFMTIIVPSENSKNPLLLEGSVIPVDQELIDIEAGTSTCITSDGGLEVLQMEHSYCRQDIDREQLWQKIARLHSKIALLETQEQKTLGRLKSLEALIAKLEQENLLSEEKLKIVENCFTTFEVTMIQ
ncbi:THAP domain-containing protein 5 isoform X2 [Sphaerodactylus townsendi]|nr:THAP domain-containing protein 5 isoform X2 [Sphaerodactylus townsendi]